VNKALFKKKKKKDTVYSKSGQKLNANSPWEEKTEVRGGKKIIVL